MYDYSFEVSLVDIPQPFSQDIMKIALDRIMKETLKGSKEFYGGQWEIVSHNLTPVDKRLMLTILVRKKIII
jgi:hypothetical protein